MDRDCNNCVYSTRDGNCRKWNCEGTKTVEDIRADAIDDFLKQFIDLLLKGNVDIEDLRNIAEQVKENK